jgi:hypothetical protein
MPHSLSTDLRLHDVAFIEEGHSLNEAASCLKTSVSLVVNVMTVCKETGSDHSLDLSFQDQSFKPVEVSDCLRASRARREKHLARPRGIVPIFAALQPPRQP